MCVWQDIPSSASWIIHFLKTQNCVTTTNTIIIWVQHLVCEAERLYHRANENRQYKVNDSYCFLKCLPALMLGQTQLLMLLKLHSVLSLLSLLAVTLLHLTAPTMGVKQNEGSSLFSKSHYIFWDHSRNSTWVEHNSLQESWQTNNQLKTLMKHLSLPLSLPALWMRES